MLGRSAGLRRRLPLGVVLACLALAGCQKDLYGHLGETEANEMIAILRENGIMADRRLDKDKTITVTVDDARFPQAVDLLKAHGFPRQSFANLGTVFASGGLIASPTEERAKMMYALEEELAQTIADIDGVLTARVHIVLEEDDLLHQNRKPSAAAVFIRYAAAVPVDHFLPQVKMLVANAVSGLTYDKVSVVLVPVTPAAQPLYPAGSPVVEGPFGLPISVVTGGAIVLALGAVALGAHLRRQPKKPEVRDVLETESS